MTHTYHSDILIVGAGPVGAYLGWKLAEAGCDLQLLEARPLAGLGSHIEVIHMDQVRFDEHEIPHPTPPELIHLVPASKVWSVDGKDYFELNYPVYVVNLLAYLQRLHGYLRKAGGKLEENARVEAVLVEDGFLKGVRGTRNGEPFEARARITVDASGIRGAVRTQLPDGFGVENTPVPPEQTFFCALELRDELPPGLPTGNNSFLGAPGFWNRSYGEGAILGIIAPGSAEAAWEAHRVWREACYGNPGMLVGKRIGSAPYRRLPASLVGNGFAGVGDSVYQNKAFSGEGITSGTTAGKILTEVLIAALDRGEASRNALWDYNVRYFHGQGAKFASVMGFLFPVNNLPRPDVDYLYRHAIIFSAHDQTYLNRNYELDLPPDRWAAICTQLETDVKEGKFSSQSLQMMKSLHDFSIRLKAHYLAYPETPAGLPAWWETTRSLWGY
jgi:digeranylgeranylglycerophospholipid reductase